MICVKKCAIFLLAITLTEIIEFVNARSIDQPVAYVYAVPEHVKNVPSNIESYVKSGRSVEPVKYVYAVPESAAEQTLPTNIGDNYFTRYGRNLKQIIVGREVIIPTELISEDVVPNKEIVKKVSEGETLEKIIEPEKQTTEVPPVVVNEEVHATTTPVPTDKEDKIRVLQVLVDGLRTVNENVLDFVRTYINKVDKPKAASEVELDSGSIDAVDKGIESVEEIVSKELTPESTTGGKTFSVQQIPPLPQKPQVPPPPQIPPQRPLNPQTPPTTPKSIQKPLIKIHEAIAKYKAAINNLLKKVKTIPQHIIKKLTSTSLLLDEFENDEQAEKETVAVEAVAETVPENEKVDQGTEVEVVAIQPTVSGRKLDILDEELLANTGLGVGGSSYQVERIAIKAEEVLESIREFNAHSLDLIRAYLNRIIELGKINGGIGSNYPVGDILARQASEI